jgi:beta-aspartyl-peptidase (threonine type)
MCHHRIMLLCGALCFAPLWTPGWSVMGQVVADRSVKEALTQILQQQVAAWNGGDIAGFMEYYWKSESLSFSSGGSTVRGWQATKDRYLRRYPTRADMGRLTFSDLEIRPLSDKTVLVLGSWRLQRKSDPRHGNFTLVFQRIGDRWVIVHDHTSTVEDGSPSEAEQSGARGPIAPGITQLRCTNEP